MCVSDECGGPGRRAFLAGALAAGLMGARGAAAMQATPRRGESVTFPSAVGSVRGYLARPAGNARRPAILVLHGEFGLPDWVAGVADELAGAGFVALAISRFSRFPELTEQALREDGRGARRFLSEQFFQEGQQEALGALAWLGRQSFVRRGRTGAVGFCGGGIQAVRLSLAAPALRAIVSFYGPPALPQQYKHPTDPIRDLVEIGSQVRVPLQMLYGTADYAVRTADVERLADSVRASGTPVEVHAFEGATHAFYDRHEPPPNAAAAQLARQHYLAFLHARLG